MSPSSAPLWNNIWRATVIYQQRSVNLLHLLVLGLLVHFFAVSPLDGHRTLPVSLPGCISEVELLGFFGFLLSLFPTSLFISIKPACLLPTLYFPLILHFLFLISKGFWISSTLLVHFPSGDSCGGFKGLSQVCNAQCIWCALAPR